MHTTAPYPTCVNCAGTGWDDDFASVCGVCLGEKVAAPRTWAARLLTETAVRAPIAARRGGAGSGRQSERLIPNLYGGPCVICRAWVEPNQGRRIRTGDGAWVTQHTEPCAASRRNSYPAPCVTCCATVPAGEGSLTKENGRWVVRHASACPVQHRAAEWAQDTPAASVARVDVQAILADVPAGRYALPCKTGSNDLDFWIVTVNQGRIDPSKKGNKWVARYVGGQGKVGIHRNEVVTVGRLLAALSSAERQAAAELFGREVGCCARCGRSLTDETSRARGLGPECAGKAW